MSSQQEWEDRSHAYKLALYIIGDEEAALMAVIHALDILKSWREREWEKRKGERWYKVCLNREFELHRLVWEHCTPAERGHEQAYRDGRACLDEEAMIIRYLKELLADGFAHNSFRLHVGLLRVLCAYPTSDAQRLYEVLVPDGSGGYEEDAYRRRKQHIMERLEKRFPVFLRPASPGGGEKRFAKKEDSADLLRLVDECLALFTPLKPRCPKLPDQFDPTTDIIEEFQSPRPRPSADWVTQREMEHTIEHRRMHAQVHPPCRDRTLEMAGLQEFGELLEVPEFFPQGGDCPPPLDRRNLPPLTPAQQRRIDFALGQLRARRERTPGDELIVTVDHVERGVLRLNAPLLRLELGAGDRMIEFKERDADGSFRRATHLLEWDDEASAAGSEAYRLKLRDGRKIVLEFNYLTRDGELAGAFVDFSYRKGLSPWLLPVAAGALLLTATASLLIYRHGRRADAG